MIHLHFSPFQFATEVAASSGHVVPVKKQITKAKARERKIAPPHLMSREEAHAIHKSPNAFVSPNPPDVMRMIKRVFEC